MMLKKIWIKLKNEGMMYSFRQVIFGSKVFLNRLSIKNYLKIIKILWIRYILHRPIPFSVIFATTYKCQCNCIHCSVSDYKKGNNDLSREEIKNVFDFIDEWGPIKIAFFGGEPLLNADIVELVHYASRKGIRTSVDTNGLLLDEDMVIALKNAGVVNINVSLDSISEQTHDLLRQKKGCFQSAIKGIKLCVQYKIPCLISTYASKRSIRERDLEEIINLARRIGVNGVKILFPILSGKWREVETEKLEAKEEKYVESLLDPSFVYIEDALAMVKNRGKGCPAVEGDLIYISPYGDVQPCFAIPISFGNIRQESMSNITKRMRDYILLKEYKSCNICLMNEHNFRNLVFSKKKKELPINVEEFII